MAFFIENLLIGLTAGALYALVALGFVLIYKASGVFNFAQGMMVYFNVLAFAYFWQYLEGSPLKLGHGSAFILALLMSGSMILVFSWVIVNLVFKRLVNQSDATLLMATLGIAYILEGVAQLAFGSGTIALQLNLPTDPVMIKSDLVSGSILVNPSDWIGALLVTIVVLSFAVAFKFTQTGRELRAVADDHQAAQSIGIPLTRAWIIVWFVGGVTALLAGILWGSKLTVDFSLSHLALRVLPVVVIGGLTSIVGAIWGGLIVGVGEILAEVYVGPTMGGAVDVWFAYVIALAVLLIRPQGLFGERIIDRV